MKKRQLSLEQRYEIQAYRESGKSVSEIAVIIGKDKSVVSRELKRNSNPKGVYKGSYAHGLAQIRKERLHRPRKMNKSMERLITSKIREEQWSPEQINGHCRKQRIPMVSIERIYQFIRVDKASGGDLYKCTRHQLKHRKRPLGGKKTLISDKRSIDERPHIVERRERIGDWEVDTIVGPQNKGAILTVVERKTGILFMRKLTGGKQADGLAKALVDILLPYKHCLHSITSDNGTEFAAHKYIAEKLKTDFFFAHPYSSWERGTNENTNKLIRQYIPKKQSLEHFNDHNIRMIQYKINARPRKKLNFESPKNFFYANLDKSVALAS